MRGIALLTLVACATTPAGRFPLRPPLTRDGDLDPVAYPCRPDPKKPGHQICHPSTYTSSLAWDGADNLVFRPLARFFAVDPAGRAVDVNSLDEVPDSSWFTNRIDDVTPDQLDAGPCAGGPRLDPSAPDEAWSVDEGKVNGATPGFRVTYQGTHYLLKSDFVEEGERATAADPIVSRLYWAAGFNVPCNDVVQFRSSVLKLKPGLTYTDNLNRTWPLDRATLERMLKKTIRHGELVRMMASRWLPGRVLGPWRYEGTRDDDPGDVVRHEDRRELRGARLLAAWVNHFDSREVNSMAAWMSSNPDDPDASPGWVAHYFLDFSDSLGSLWSQDGISRRLGYSYYLDFRYVLTDWLTFGLIVRPWDVAHKDPEGDIFGYFNDHPFSPSGWKPGYANPAFDRMTDDDAAWMARLIARFDEPMVRAAVATGALDEPRHVDFLVRVLLARRDAILRRFLLVRAPIARVSIEDDRICAIDLARRSGVFGDDSAFRYAAALGKTALPVHIEPQGRICVDVPRANAGYEVVRIVDGASPASLLVHVVDGAGALALVGVEHPAP